MHLQHVRTREGFLWQRAGLCMTFNEFVRTHPVEEVLAAVPRCENYIWVAVVDRSQHLVGNKARHPIHQPRTLSKSFFERISELRRDVDTIGDSDHFGGLPLFDDTTTRHREVITLTRPSMALILIV